MKCLGRFNNLQYVKQYLISQNFIQMYFMYVYNLMYTYAYHDIYIHIYTMSCIISRYYVVGMCNKSIIE